MSVYNASLRILVNFGVLLLKYGREQATICFLLSHTYRKLVNTSLKVSI